MDHYHDAIYCLQQQMDRAAALRGLIPELQKRHEQLSARVKEARQVMLRRQQDVKRLEGWSLTALYYHAAGKQEARLEKEREEVLAARKEYDAAAAALQALEVELVQAETELAGLEGCDAKYRAVLSEKLAYLKSRGGETAAQISSMETRIANLEVQKKEVRDAILAGNAVLYAASRTKDCLDGAKAHNIADLASNGILSGLFDRGKNSDLEEAKACAEDFRSKLSVFRDKLAVLCVSTAFRIDIAEFRYFGDYFFNGLFADLAFHDKLSSAMSELDNAVKQVDSTIAGLKSLMDKLNKDQERTHAKLDKLVRKAK